MGVNHHPVLYTATMKMFIFLFESIGGLNLALGMMVLGQMLMMSFTLGAMLIWLKYHGAGKVWIGVSLAFVSLHSGHLRFSFRLPYSLRLPDRFTGVLIENSE